MSTGNDGDVKVDDDVATTDNVKVVKVEKPKAAPKPTPKIEPAKVQGSNQVNAAIVFIAQRFLDAPEFETFKQLYPALFE